MTTFEAEQTIDRSAEPTAGRVGGLKRLKAHVDKKSGVTPVTP